MPQISVSDETYAKIKDQLTEEPSPIEKMSLFHKGQKWFLRTVTYHWVGEVVGCNVFDVGEIIKLKNASYVADSGRFSDAVKSGALAESEYVGDAIVNLSAVTDGFPWNHPLPTKSK